MLAAGNRDPVIYFHCSLQVTAMLSNDNGNLKTIAEELFLGVQRVSPPKGSGKGAKRVEALKVRGK